MTVKMAKNRKKFYLFPLVIYSPILAVIQLPISFMIQSLSLSVIQLPITLVIQK